MSYFLQKTKKCIFGLILEKPKNLRKNPRTQDCFEKPKILGENSSSGNAVHSACLMSSSLFLRIPETPAIFRCQLISDVGILSVSCFRIAQHSDPYRKIGSMSSSRIIMLISLFFG